MMSSIDGNPCIDDIDQNSIPHIDCVAEIHTTTLTDIYVLITLTEKPCIDDIGRSQLNVRTLTEID